MVESIQTAIHQWMDKQNWLIRKTEYYSAMKRNEL